MPAASSHALVALALTSGPAAAADDVVGLQPAPASVAVTRRVSLTDLAPAHGRWFLLRTGSDVWHLEVAEPARVQVSADRARQALALTDADGETTCRPWRGSPSPLERAEASGEALAPICGGRLWLRTPQEGKRSPLEWSAELVRDRLDHGEALTTLVKQTLFKDRYLQEVELDDTAAPVAAAAGPRPLSTLPAFAEDVVAVPHLDIPLDEPADALPLGRWVPAAAEGVWVSAATPGSVAVSADRAPDAAPDPEERDALALLVAFDLSRLELAYEVGTEHPRVGWSRRVPPARRTPGLPGPDGLADVGPLARTGQVAPWEIGRLVAAFTAGFKRSHGAFKWGPYAGRNRGSHYGFVQDGVVLSTLQPGLATLIVGWDGEVEVTTWPEESPPPLAQIRHARQNGVPLVEPGDDGVPQAGALVEQWGAGNWSGSAEGELRSLRSSACILEPESEGEPRHLVVGWFSAATPAGMARVLLAAGCEHAMLLDMNALEHTYLAVYEEGPAGTPVPGHVHDGMSVLDDEDEAGRPLPRFVAIPDNRDFFVVLRREEAP